MLSADLAIVAGLVLVWLALTVDGLGRQWADPAPPRHFGWRLEEARRCRESAAPKIGEGAESLAHQGGPQSFQTPPPTARRDAVYPSLCSPLGWLPSERPPRLLGRDLPSLGEFTDPPPVFDGFEQITPDPEAASA